MLKVIISIPEFLRKQNISTTGTTVQQPTALESSHDYSMTMTKGYKEYIGTTSAYGKMNTLQALDSDVILTIPKGIRATVIAHIHTHTQDILQNIPDGECLIAPVPDYSCIVRHRENDNDMFEVKIRHCAAQNWRRIIVSCGDIHNGVPFTKMKKRNKFSPKDGNHYTVDKKFITIYTSHFCQFLCTLCGEQCRGEIQALSHCKTT